MDASEVQSADQAVAANNGLHRCLGNNCQEMLPRGKWFCRTCGKRKKSVRTMEYGGSRGRRVVRNGIGDC